MHEIYELKEMLCRELEEYGRKGEMSAGSLEIVDKLAHAIKNLCKIIEYSEMEDGGYSEAGGSYRQGQGGGGGNRYSRDGGGNRYSREGQGGGGSYARGRGSNARRDSRGRYSRMGEYSYAEDGVEDIIMELKEVAQELPEQKQREVMKFVQKMEQM